MRVSRPVLFSAVDHRPLKSLSSPSSDADRSVVCVCVVLCLQECLRASQTQVSLLNRPSLEEGAGEQQEDQEDLEHLEGQWSAAAGDSSTLVQSKEARLQLVTLYTGQTEAARTTLERLETELEAGGR